MKSLSILFILLLLASCSKPIEEWTSKTKDMSNIKGLEDCKFIDINQGSRFMQVVRCPNSSTTTSYNSGKVQYSNTVTESNNIPQ